MKNLGEVTLFEQAKLVRQTVGGALTLRLVEVFP